MSTRERTFQALDRVSAAAIGSPDLSSLLPRLLQVLQETVPVVDTVAVLLREGDVLRVASLVGLSLEAGLSVRVGEGVSGQVAATGQPLFVRDAATDPRVASDTVRQSGLRALYAVPLVLDDELLGVAHMGSRSSHEFSDEDLLLFRTIGTAATTDPEAAKFVGKFTKNPMAVTYESADNGKIATYFARWTSRRGGMSNWSAPASLAIAA
jgi:GAF domain-containing protein